MFSWQPLYRDVIAVAQLCLSSQQQSKQESRAVARKSRDAAAVIFPFKVRRQNSLQDNLSVAKLRKPGFRAPNIPAQNRI